MSEEQTSPASDPGSASADEHYQVLARKYRPRSFEDLVGQGAMVKTLTNAFASGRLAHAFILAGVRGVGKTTTARIVAKALNCTGPDDQGGPTISPCGVCDSCTSIAEDRHVDVLEMDAASRTGVDDIRELIEGVRYRPVSARYKVYIVDEVHMLSRNAFNALLKTLEEPPEHVKFIFATTEIRRVPVTVLSRCQRFDLRRIDIEDLAGDFGRIAKLEGANITDAALSLIARAADGSHRDGLSLLDQAIATGSDEGALDEPQLRAMLGLADRGRSYDLLEALMRGDAAGALGLLEDDYRAGADPLMLLRDLLEIVHWLTRVKAVPTALDGAAIAEIDRVRGKEMTEALSMAALTRAWQMLLKGLQEAQSSPVPVQAVEMIFIRLAYLTELPTPAEAVKSMAAAPAVTAQVPSTVSAPAPPAPEVSTAPAAQAAPVSQPPVAPPDDAPRMMEANASPQANLQASPEPQVAAAEPAPIPQSAPPETAPDGRPLAHPQSFEDVIALAAACGEHVLRAQLVSNVRLVRFEPAQTGGLGTPGKIEFGLTGDAPREMVNELHRFLNANAAGRWAATISQESGADTLSQQAAAAEAARKQDVAGHPMVLAIMETFPGSEIEAVRDLTPPRDGGDALPVAALDDDDDDLSVEFDDDFEDLGEPF